MKRKSSLLLTGDELKAVLEDFPGLDLPLRQIRSRYQHRKAIAQDRRRRKLAAKIQRRRT